MNMLEDGQETRDYIHAVADYLGELEIGHRELARLSHQDLTVEVDHKCLEALLLRCVSVKTVVRGEEQDIGSF